ncbi:MAG: M28 family peptidase [Deltaproteobacteria bacterium]|nr:M28 family peptidase [Deltaproteobacteria bacterium]
MATARAADERGQLLALIERIVDECPRRQPTSEDERRASQIFVHEFERLGLQTEVEEFRFNDNLYANVALHFGLASAATAVSPLLPAVACALHTLAGASYYADSTRRGYLLRRLLGFKRSQNVLGRLPADGEPALRVIALGHVDAAFTGLIFDERFVRLFSATSAPPPLDRVQRGLALATYCQFALAGFDLARTVLGPLTWPLRPIEHLLNVPGTLSALFALETVLRDRIVPGANDNLTGAVALCALARRLAPLKPDDVELLFVATGCEEASLGGADALIRRHGEEWPRDRTVFIALDSLTNGELRYLDREGEVRRTPVVPWLAEILARTAAAEPRFASVTPFEPPVGGSDAAACMAHGYPAVGLTCIDPELGSPRHYHQLSDTPANLDLDQLMVSIDYAELLVRELIRSRRPSRRQRPATRRRAKRPAAN